MESIYYACRPSSFPNHLVHASSQLDSSAAQSWQPPDARMYRRPSLPLLTLGTMINYLVRTVISVAAPLLTKDLGLDAARWNGFSAFSWTYAASQIPGGILLDRFGVRLDFFWSVTLWSDLHAAAGICGPAS